MPSDKRNSIMAKATRVEGRGEGCSAYNAIFVDLPVSSFVSHSSVLTMRGMKC